jgi:histidine kinase
MRYELKKSSQPSLQYENIRKELIPHISHDLKTPITSIKEYVKDIIDESANAPEKQKSLTLIIIIYTHSGV